jgi:hypothetical protein
LQAGTKFSRAKEKILAAHTKRGRRQKSVSGKSNSSSVTSERRMRGDASALKDAGYGIGRREVNHARSLKAELNERKVDLIKVDLETAFTFMKIAQEAGDDQEKRLRNREHARRGYDAVTHFLETAKLGRSEREAIDRRIGQLKTALEDLGESVS